MKKVLLSTLLIAASALLYTGCSKDDDDTTAPEVTLIGDNPIFVDAISEDFQITDPGATATDNEDGDLTASIVKDYSEYVKNFAGEYEVHYEATDKAGNTGDVHRTLYVTNTNTQLAGSWACNDTSQGGTPVPYTLTATTSTISKYRLLGANFSGGAFTDPVYMTFEANRITIPNQQPNGSGSIYSISGSGTITKSGAVYTMRLSYTIANSSNGSTNTYRSTMVSL